MKGEEGMKRKAKKAAAAAMALLIAVTGVPDVQAFAAASEGGAVLQEGNEYEQPLRLWYDTPADVNTAGGAGGAWTQESLPLGNGDLGGLIFGGIEKDRIHFNHKTLWTGGPSPSRPNYQFGNKDTAYTAREIQNYRDILDDKSEKVFNMGDYGIGMGAGIPFSGAANQHKGQYQDFGDIWLDFSPAGFEDSRVKDYERDLDLRTAVATTSFTMNGIRYTREHFVSAPDECMVTRLTASKGQSLSFDAKMELNNGGLSAAKLLDESENMYVINGTVSDNGLKFCTAMQIVPTGGTISLNRDKQTYEVRKADEVLIVMSADTNYLNDYPVYRDNGKDLAGEVGRKVKDCGQMTYEELFSRHEEDYTSLFQRVELDLGEPAPLDLPTNVLVDRYRNGKYSAYLEVLAFQYGRYLTIAGSRGGLPSNLVGLWTVGASAWTGDYHFNINVQMNYWPVYVTNLAECGKTLVNYMESLREPGRLTAERVHGITDATIKHNGFTVHTVNNPFGMTAPPNVQEYGWNPSGAAWALQGVYDYYRFTKDKDYLKETIYPIIKEAAMFWDNYLYESAYQKIEDEDSALNGQPRLVVSPSLSEEQGPTVAGSTYDQSLVWELYKECIEAADIVGETDTALVETWKSNFARLDPININATNGIKEWYEETRVGQRNGHNQSFAQAGELDEIPVPNSGWNIGHPGEQRHASHLVGLYPGTLINIENPEYMEAAIQSLNERGFYSTGWSKANKINLWARTGQGDHALKTLRNLIGGNSSGLQYNLFDSHGSGGGETMMNGSVVWQIDGNYGLTAGVAEMLVQSQLGYTQFLPAVPKAWQNGQVTGLKARGNFTIGEKWQNGLAQTFTVEYEGGGQAAEFTGAYKDIAKASVYADGKEIEAVKDTDTDQIRFEARKGVVYTIDIGSTNADEIQEKGEALLEKLHPDLTVLKQELKNALRSERPDAGQLHTIIRKGEAVNRIYGKFLQSGDGIYCMTVDKGMSSAKIYEMYADLMQIKRSLLDNTENIETYLEQEQTLLAMEKTMEEQMENAVISFSKPSGIVDPADSALRLSRHADAPKRYDIRYTTDGTMPLKNSSIYENPIQLSTVQDTAVRAALFRKQQRVSPVFSSRYVVKGIDIRSASSNITANWGANYTLDKLYDKDTATRWASKNPVGNVEIVLELDQKQKVDTIRFDQFVSSRNSTDQFEIQYFNGTEFVTAYEGAKLGSESDKTGDLIQPDAGYHAIKAFSFQEVETDRLKLVIKSYTGEPSFFEMEPFFMGDSYEDTQGNAEELIKTLTNAKAAVERMDPMYTDGNPILKRAFEEAIWDCEGAIAETQSSIDSKEYMLYSLYNSLGLGEETDRSELEELLSRAEQESQKPGYTRDSIYLLKKAITTAREVMEDAQARQPHIDAQTAILSEKLSGLVSRVATWSIEAGEGIHQGEQWKTAGTGYLFNTVPQGEELTYQFTGTGIRVISVKAPDHGKMKITIRSSQGDPFEEITEIDCYISSGREEPAEILNRQGLVQGDYAITFQHAGGGSGSKVYVEVGGLQVTGIMEEPAPDRTGLEALIAKCRTFGREEYTKGTFEVLLKALENAEHVLGKEDEETCNEEIKDALGELTAAKMNLIPLDQKEAKNKLLAAKGVLNENYTESSWKNFQAAISNLEALLNGDAVQQELDEAVNALEHARKGLVIRADKSKLQSSYDRVKQIDFSNYTTDSANAVKNLFSAIESVLTDPDAEQNKVDQIQSQLAKAVESLTVAERKAASIRLAVSKKTLGVKEKFKLSIQAEPSGAKTGHLTFASSNKKIVSVSSKGVVTAKKKGKATITVLAENGISKKCRITVKPAPAKIVLKTRKKTLKRKGTMQLKVKLSKGSAGKITYISKNKRIAAVNEKGKVKALKKGRVTIVVKTYNGKKDKIRLTIL